MRTASRSLLRRRRPWDVRALCGAVTFGIVAGAFEHGDVRLVIAAAWLGAVALLLVFRWEPAR